MWFSVEEYLVEERKTLVDSASCKSGQAALQLWRRDVRVSVFLFPRKIVSLVCADSGKTIKERAWDEPTRKAAEQLKREHKAPTWGYWAFGIIAAVVFTAVPLGFYLEVRDNLGRPTSFVSRSNWEKQQAIKSLGAGDLIATATKVYKIKEKGAADLTLVESTLPMKTEYYLEGFSNESFPGETFTGQQLIVKKFLIETGRVASNDDIVNVFDQ